MMYLIEQSVLVIKKAIQMKKACSSSPRTHSFCCFLLIGIGPISNIVVDATKERTALVLCDLQIIP